MEENFVVYVPVLISNLFVHLDTFGIFGILFGLSQCLQSGIPPRTNFYLQAHQISRANIRRR